MRIVLAIIGSIVGAVLGSGAHELLGLVLGALAGFGLAELNLLRQRLGHLEDELSALRRIVAGQPRSDSDPESREAGQSWRVEAKACQPEAAAEAGASGAAVHASQYPTAPGTRDANPVFRLVREYFTGGNALVRVGMIILFFGVAFLLRYIAEHSKVPVSLRLSGVAAGALALLVLGWRLRRKRPGYALALQGGAVGILYLTIFAGLRLYSLLPAEVAFALLVFLATVSAALAVLQNSQTFALLAVSGGFLAPVLASNGHGSHIVLFTYYAVLNAAIIAVAWFRAWRVLNLAGFLFTFVIGTVWGVLSYQPSLFASTEPFLILFSLFYVAIAVLFATRQPPQLRGYVDGTLVFGTPVAAFGVQSTMVHGWPYALAYSALAAGAFYLVISWLLRGMRRQTHRLLVEAFSAIGVLFLTLAVPLALDGRWSAATWALEGAALVWIGCRQERRLARGLGALLQIAAGVLLWLELDSPHGRLPVFNSTFLGGVLVSAASVLAASLLHRYRERLVCYEGPIASLLYFWGLLWWLFNGLTEIQRRVPDRYDAGASLLFFAGTALISGALYGGARLTFARLPALCLLPAMILYAALAVVEVHHPLADAGWVAWPLAFAALYFLYRRHEGAPGTMLANTLHAGAAWLLIALATWEAAWAVQQATSARGSWAVIVWALVPALALFLIPRLARRIVWPFAAHEQAYAAIAGTGFALYLAIWGVATNVSLPGDAAPFPFLPLLNPLDLAEAFVLLVLLRFWLHLRAARYPLYTGVKEGAGFAIVAVLAFVWLNAALLRTLHHWAAIPFRLEAMLHSTLVQTALTIFWAALALTIMLAATRERIRAVWLTGAALLCVVIAKLFLVDLSHVGTIERIVSFVGVGLLMLVIGYFSPLPPASARPRETG